jgi:EAL domain-containing protein (putative c-di-GMP-specific phosphodiesterase class I)
MPLIMPDSPQLPKQATAELRVKNMLNDQTDRTMVEMISRLAGAMGKRTIAEFVENKEILEALREIGVDYAQGFAIGAPEPFPSCYARLNEEEDFTARVA